MNNVYPLTLLYDAACPVCSLEMDHLRARNDDNKLVFISISEPGFDASAWGTTLTELNAEMHGVTPSGEHLLGLAALRAAYAATDAAVGLGWVLKFTAWGPLAPLADIGYRWFAKHRLTISATAAPLINARRLFRDRRARRVHQRMARCQDGACDINARGD